MKEKSTRLDLIIEYECAPDETMFAQETVAAIRNCSVSTVIRERWVGNGVPFIKDGRKVRYRKWEIRAWLVKHQSFQSTTQAQELTANR